ncbi:hypothetical protein PHAVU_008G191100 [Phaseolus vulgaris]|uniref:Uncharacterized protein n=1 Tax=Phaseolus vulgaris TaxID=3885 RepID=V7B645_PHAVU|nr:hypothetical protein PHAVU_008G191100g [Phaseolus vulgaris]ESW13382.1 hypothetical protein PHAVU_008G191100g [Phaseolus vulgaris]
MHFRMFKPFGLNHAGTKCWGVFGNKVVFENGRVDLVEVFTVAQRKTWSWVTVKEKSAAFSYSDWCLDPICCMRYLKV